MKGIKPADFNDKQMIFQIGVPPVRIDILMGLPAVSYQKAWRNKKKVRYGQTQIYVLGKEDLIAAKEKANRPQDQIDINNLERK